jgi:hypothetical protein
MDDKKKWSVSHSHRVNDRCIHFLSSQKDFNLNLYVDEHVVVRIAEKWINLNDATYVGRNALMHGIVIDEQCVCDKWKSFLHMAKIFHVHGRIFDRRWQRIGARKHVQRITID